MNNKSIERVAVVILNYKAVADTVECVESLMKQSFSNFDIILVENGSRDNSITEFKKIEKKYKSKVIALYNDTNLGFTGGVNTGIRWALEAGYNYIGLFNNDARAEKMWLENLTSTIQRHEEYGTVTSLLLHEDGTTIDSTGEQYSKWGLPFPRSRGNKTEIAPPASNVFGATGGASIYRSSMLREIGLFDEDFFAYYEDVDISFRAQLAGWKIFYQPKAIAYHRQGGTSSKMPGFTTYQTFKNLPMVYIKNIPQELLLSIGIRFWIAYWLMFFKALTHHNRIFAIKGLFQGALLTIKAIKKRRHIQQARKVPTSYIQQLIWPDLPPDQTGLRKLRRIFTGK